MQAAFLLLVAKPGRRLGERELSLSTQPAPPGLHFEPDQQDSWADQSSRVALGFWRNSHDSRTSGAWSVDERGASATTGPVRVAGRPWAAGGRWAADCAASVDVAQPGRHRLRGVFTLVRADRDGGGFVVGDPLALSFTYHGETNDFVVVSSRAALAASALSAGGAPRRDPLGVCGLAHSSYRIGHRTGFDGVQTLPAGAHIVLRPSSGATLVSAPWPWMPDSGITDDPRAALDLILDEITEIVATSLTAPATSRVADLTGGKDSRLVLAAAVHAGVADQFTFRTHGAGDLGDVQVASQLAERMGLRHEAELRMTEPPPYAERLARFVSVSGGVVNAWDLKSPGARPPGVRLSGANGECLRAHAMVEQPPRSDADLIRYFDDVLRFGQLDLVKPDVVGHYREVALAILLEGGSGVMDPLDQLESFQIQTRARARYGPLEELDPDHRILGLYSIDAIRAAFALGSRQRQLERVHYELMRRVSPILVNEPFARLGWSSELKSAAVRSVSSRPEHAGPQPNNMPLMGQLRLSKLDERRSVHEAVLADVGNPAWGSSIERGQSPP